MSTPPLPPPHTSTSSIAPPKKSYTYYHAGPLFTLSDLHTNTLLSSHIQHLSSTHPTNPTFTPLVPQNIEPRDIPVTPLAIRDQDIRSLLSCDLALFTFDGSELDSGTVVEFCIAKFADIPAVILRTDFRGGGDQGGSEKGDPWNLMCSGWPRCVGVVVDGMAGYKAGLSVSGGDAVKAGEGLLELVAERVVEAMNKVVGMKGVMPREVRESVWRWIGVMPAFGGVGGEGEVQEMLGLLRGKEEKGLL